MYSNYFNSMPMKQEVTWVNGEAGARSYRMAPSSSCLLLDETAPLVWLCQTDGAGYMTVSPYSISPYKPPEPVNLNTIMDRLERLEAKLNESHPATVAENTAVRTAVE